MKQFLIALLGLAASFICMADANRHTGIYVIVRGSSFDDGLKALEQPYVDGATLYLGLSLLMPKKGVYDWSYADKIIEAAARNGKNVNLAFLPGRWVPEWFYEEGVKRFQWVHETNLVEPGKYDASAPIPWDPQLLELLSAMMQEAGKRYGRNPTVAAVQVVGPSLTNGLEAHFNVKPEQAARAGYTPEKFIEAWKIMFQATAEAFPEKQLCWCIHDMFPNGRDAKPGRTIRDWAFKKYGTRLHLLACYLTHESWFKKGNQAVDIWAERNHEIASGLQLINIYSTCGFTPEQMESAFRNGVREGADYFEIFVEELRKPQYAAVVEKVHKELQK